MTSNPLDNPVWHALTGPHSDLAIGRGAARHYPRDAAPFSAIAEPTAQAYADLAADLPAAQEARLFRPEEEPPPPGWETTSARPIVQMVLERSALPPPLAGEARIVPLGGDDVVEMVALVAATAPGPFGRRTIELGSYVGVKDAATGHLIAMAGERFRLSRHVELSAIAVHPRARGQGLGAALTVNLARAALSRDLIPFLHVFPENSAMGLYARLGFRERARLWVLWHQPTGQI